MFTTDGEACPIQRYETTIFVPNPSRRAYRHSAEVGQARAVQHKRIRMDRWRVDLRLQSMGVDIAMRSYQAQEQTGAQTPDGPTIANSVHVLI